MLEDLKKEIHDFQKDIDENIKNEKDLLYIKERTAKLLDIVLSDIEKVMHYKEEQMNELIKKQEVEELKLQELAEKINNVYEDIYDEEEDGFSVNCPYCNYEFEASIDENFNEIRCPECENLIELDWEGNPNDDTNSGCNGNCPHCGGCE